VSLAGSAVRTLPGSRFVRTVDLTLKSRRLSRDGAYHWNGSSIPHCSLPQVDRAHDEVSHTGASIRISAARVGHIDRSRLSER